MVFLMSDLELPIRDRTYREPDGAHVVVVRGRDLAHALEHLAARADCRALAVVGVPDPLPDLQVLAGRRLLVVDADRGRMRALAEAGMDAGADVEWLLAARLPIKRIAAWALPVFAIVLAAGAATRMGGNKMLLDVDGQPVVRHVIEAAVNGGCHGSVVVYADPAVKAAVEPASTCVFNDEATSGMASSLRAGLRSLPGLAAGGLVMLGDQPLVGARTVEAILKSWRREGSRPAVAAAYPGVRDGARWQPPVLLDRSLWPELMRLTGDAGARQLFDQQPELLDTAPVPGRPDDIDTPEDYAKIVRLFPRPGAR
jgi:molybdenum cofactor cytidylyltransferase